MPSVVNERDDARRRLAGLTLLRVLIASALFGAALMTSFSSDSPESVSRGNLFVYLAAAYVSAAIEFVWILTGWQLRRLSFVHAGAETALAAWLVALTGGADSPFTFLLLIATVLGSVAAGSRGAFISATLGSLALMGMLVGVPIPGFVGPLQPGHVESRTIAVVVASAGGCFATAALASYLTERLQRAGRALGARETELRELGALYLNVAQSLHAGLMTLGPMPQGHPGDSLVTLLNDPGAAIVGISATTAHGRPLRDSVPELAQALDAVVAGRGRSDCSIHLPDRTVLLGFTISPLKSEVGEIQGSVVTFQDLTSQRRLEEAVRRQSHLASLGELAAGLAHEVRNPLAALSGAAQLLRAPTELDSRGGSDDQKLFTLIQRETGHLETLVSDFLTFARPPAPSMREGDLTELVRSTLDAFRAGEQLGQRRLSSRLALVRARFDEGQIRQVLWNLLRNALEATADDGEIALALTLDSNEIQITVRDDGPGIPLELRERIFEPFFTTKERGTGLGLALVARIVGAHDGTIGLEESIPRGTRVAVRLPRAL